MDYFPIGITLCYPICFGCEFIFTRKEDILKTAVPGRVIILNRIQNPSIVRVESPEHCERSFDMR